MDSQSQTPVLAGRIRSGCCMILQRNVDSMVGINGQSSFDGIIKIGALQNTCYIIVILQRPQAAPQVILL